MKHPFRFALSITIALALLFLPSVFASDELTIQFLNKEDGSPFVKDEEVTVSIKEGYDGLVEFKKEADDFYFLDDPEAETYFVSSTEDYPAKIKIKLLADQKPSITASSYDSSVLDTPTSELPKQIEIQTDGVVFTTGEKVSVPISLLPDTADLSYTSRINWSVLIDDEEINSGTGSTILFKAPEINQATDITLKASLNLNSNLTDNELSDTKVITINPENINVQIYPSIDNPAVLTGTDVGFSSEILTGEYIASTEITEGAQYSWTCQLDNTLVNGNNYGTTYSYYANQVGKVSVSLTVTLKDGTVLSSEPYEFYVVDQEAPLKTISIIADTSESESLVDKKLSFTYQTDPIEATNMAGAKWHWVISLDNQTVFESEDHEISYVPETPGILSVYLEITPVNGETITSNTLNFNITKELETSSDPTDESKPSEDSNNDSIDETNSNENLNDEIIENSDLKILSVEITSEDKLEDLTTKQGVILNAKVESEGEGEISYLWQLLDGETVLKESDQKDNFNVSSETPKTLTVVLKAYEKGKDINNNQSELIEKQILAQDELSINFKASDLSSENTKPDKDQDNTINSEKTEEKVDNQVSQDTSENTEDKTQIKEETKKTDIAGSEQATDQNKFDSKNSETQSEAQKSPSLESVENSKPVESNTTESKTIQNSPVTLTSNNQSGRSQTKSEIPNVQTTSYRTRTNSTSQPQNSSIMNNKTNINNPKTGKDFTLGEVLVLFTCTTLIILASNVLIKKILVYLY